MSQEPRRPRGLKFWLITLLVVLVGLPLGLYLSVLLAIGLGFLNNTVAAQVAEILDTPVRVGGVSSSLLSGARVDDLTAEGSDKQEALKIGAVTAEWTSGEMLLENRIRQVTIVKPRLILRQMANGEWNLRPKPPEKTEGGYRIERIGVDDGQVTVELAAGKLVRLQSLKGTLVNAGKTVPASFSFTGVFDSLEGFSATGALGPGAAWNARLYGGLFFDRDLGTVLGPGWQGHLRYDLSGQCQSTLLDETQPGPIRFGGRFDLKDSQFMLDPALLIVLPQRAFDLRGEIAHTRTRDSDWLELRDLHVLSDDFGQLSASGKLDLKSNDIDLAGKAQLNLAALYRTLSPAPFGNVTFDGTLETDNATFGLRSKTGGKQVTATADLKLKDARVQSAATGQLNAINATATLQWPALRDISVQWGDLLQAKLNLPNLLPGGDWTEIANGAVINSLQLDLGRFLESELGRRAITGRFDAKQPAPLVGELPVLLKGIVRAKDLRLPAQTAGAGQSTISFSGMELTGISVQYWPFPFPIPAKQLNGELNGAVRLVHWDPTAITLSGKLADAAAGTQKLSAEFSGGASLEHGRWKMQPIKLTAATVPFAELEPVFSFKKLAGVTPSGTVQILEGTIDPNTERLTAKIKLKDVAANVILPPNVRSAAISLLMMTKYGMIAPLLETIQSVDLTPINADLDVEKNGGRLTAKGRVELGIQMPISWLGSRMFPPLDVALTIDTSRPELSTYTADLNFSGNNIHVEAQQTAADVWKVTGNVQAAPLAGTQVNFDTAYNAKTRNVGQTILRIKEIDLQQAEAALRGMLTQAAALKLRGKGQEIEASIEPFTIGAATLPAGRLLGKFDNVDVLHPAHEFSGMSGDFTCNLSFDKEGEVLNGIVRLQKYGALLNDGAIRLQQGGRPATVKLVGKYVTRDPNQPFLRLDLCQLNLSDNIVASANGGRIDLTPGLELKRLELPSLQVEVPNLRQALKVCGLDDLSNRDPWFESIDLVGRSLFDGTVVVEAGGLGALSGKAQFNNAALKLSGGKLLAAGGISGDVPINLRWGKWPAGPAPEQRGTLKIDDLKAGEWRLNTRQLELLAKPNELQVLNPFELAAPQIKMSVTALSVRDFFQRDGMPEIALNVAPRIELDQMLRQNGLTFNGMEDCVLASSAPLTVNLRKGPGFRDAQGKVLVPGAWDLKTTGAIRGPFFGGEIIVERLGVRGLFGHAPVFGGDLYLRSDEGIKVTQIFEKNFLPMKFAMRANFAVRYIETLGLNLEDLQAFVFDVDSVDFKDNEFWYNGHLAWALDAKKLRESFPSLISDESIKEKQFGVRRLALQVELKPDGKLYGPRPKLAQNLVIESYGTTINPFARTFKNDVQGIPGDNNSYLWSEIVAKLKAKK